MVRTFLKVYMELCSSFFVSAKTNKRHHHHNKQFTPEEGYLGCLQDMEPAGHHLGGHEFARVAQRGRIWHPQ